MTDTKLTKRVEQISRKLDLSHLGSNLTAVGIIDKIYSKKRPDEPFVLSAGHAGLALYVVLEKYQGQDAEALYHQHGTHPNRAPEQGIYVSTGSLGWGLTIALGMAMANRKRNVHCLISDGESFEGTVYEVANVMRRYQVTNLAVHINFNGWAAYHKVGFDHIARVNALIPGLVVHETSVEWYGLSGQSAHYVKYPKT